MTPDGEGPSARPLCDDTELGYLRNRTVFMPGDALRLDESYRLAHLPLVAPRHPDVIARMPGRFYELGRHARVFSLVLPVDDRALQSSAAFRSLDDEIRAASFGRKIAWEVMDRRSDRLHATICGSLGQDTPPEISAETRQALRAIGPVRIALRGLFSGNVNLGRLYLRAYPERRNGHNALHAVQAALGRPTTDLYLVGLYHFVDHLTTIETAALAALIERWWDKTLLEFTAKEFWLLGAHDDLVLESAVAERLPLGAQLETLSRS